MKKSKRIVVIVLRLFLGLMMMNGGIKKFEKPIPSPAQVLEKANKFSAPEKVSTLGKILYISGMKQTGYAWQFLGGMELLLGLLLILQRPAFIGAVLLLPITLQIFLFHAFLEADEIGELLLTAAYFAINVFLVFDKYPQWKKLVWLRD
jgi:uncharacterized membrane protein YphA (DoxX/SURF4 family)